METKQKTLLKGIKRAAKYYKCSVASIQKLVNEGIIPSYRIGRNRYFYAEEIDDALRDKSEEINKREGGLND